MTWVEQDRAEPDSPEAGAATDPSEGSHKTFRELLRYFRKDIRKRRRTLVGGALFGLVYAAARVAEPWPLKVVFDQVLSGKQMPGWLASLVNVTLGLTSKYAVLNFAARLYTYVTLTIREGPSGITLESLDTDERVHFHDVRRIEYNGVLDLLKAAVARAGIVTHSSGMYSMRWAVKVQVRSEAPPASGLGSSADRVIPSSGAPASSSAWTAAGQSADRLRCGRSPLPTSAQPSGVSSQLVSRARRSAPRSSSSRTTSTLPL